VNLLFGLLMLCVVGLGVRQWLLVKHHGARGRRVAERQQRVSWPLPARPGNIYAVAGDQYVLLASSRQVRTCFADPTLLRDGEIAATAVAVGEAVGVDPVRLYEKFLHRRSARFVRVFPALGAPEGLNARQVAAVRALRHPAVGILHEWRRVYPNGGLAADVVGFRRVDGQPGGGLELTRHAYLAARDGRRVALADARRRAIWPLVDDSRVPADGDHLLLCLDVHIQRYLQEAVSTSVDRHGAEWGAGVVVDPYTGEVLAMCSVPSFDPAAYDEVAPERRTNRAVSCPYEPGSVIKPLFAAAAVNAGVVGYDTRIFCENGSYAARKGGWISDHGHSYGWLSLVDVVVKSSNIGMAKIGEMLGNRALHGIARAYGFGERTGVALAGESGGQLRPLRLWDGYSLRRVPFGQEISATTLQLAMAFSAVANGGLLLRPRIVDRVVDPTGRTLWRSRRRVVRRVLRPAVAARTVEVMRQVVRRGTGRRAKLRHWSVFGKTGTAQIAGPGGYTDGAYVGSFVGGAPVRRPRVLCLISIYWPDRSKGYYGGVVAAPFVKEVLANTLAYLDVPPDGGAAVASAGR
jgi:cell division protein FtsI/penicillin-binding protein 2